MERSDTLIIYITSHENEFLFKDIAEELNINIMNIAGQTNLLDFVKKDFRNLNSCEHLIIDLKAIEEKTSIQEISSAVSCFRQMYGNTRITVVAIGYKHGNTILGILFGKGVYNIISAPESNLQKLEIEKCFSDEGMLYRDSCKFEIQDLPLLVASNEKVIIKKENRKQTITIGVVGTQAHIGTTTQALLITKFLSELPNISSCYIETKNTSGIKSISDYYQETTVDEKIHRILYEGLEIYTSEGNTAEIIGFGYDFLIYDMGNFQNFDEKDKESFIQKDIKIVVSGNKAWETVNLKKVKDELSKNDLVFIFSFTPEDEKNIIKDMLKKISEKIYFSDYIPYPFQVKNKLMYETIFKNFIPTTEIENKTTKKTFKIPKINFLRKNKT